MKLPEHVDKLRSLIEGAFDKHFARMGIGKNKLLDIERIPEEVRPYRFRFEEMLENHIGETGDYKNAREKLIDELTFTLFNRLAAVKVMETAALFPPVLTKQPEHGGRSFGHKAWLEVNPHMSSEELEGIREYLKHAFNELGKTFPLYSEAYPFALLPDTISLNEIIDAFNEIEKDSQVGSDIWQDDDVLGWMYESYNNAKKKAQKDSGEKIEYNKVSLQSQFYTPRWVVRFLVENSLGKLYLEMYPDSEIKQQYKIANAPQTQVRQLKPLNEVKVIDPACGSGNFLLYAFDFFYELYIDQINNYGAEYEEKEIPKWIIENNLHGIDLDDRAVQLAQLGLFIKAKKKSRTIGELAFNVVSSDFYLPEYEDVEHIFTKGSNIVKSQQELIEGIWTNLQFAYKFGSLIYLDEKIKARMEGLEAKQNSAQIDMFTAMEIEAHKSFADTFFASLKTAVEQYAQTHDNTFLTSKTRDAITFLELLTTEYDVATANPPYTDSADFGPELKDFIEINYKGTYKFHTNLYATFIKRCYDFVNKEGFVAMVHPQTFMYIKTFEDVRKFIINKTHINIFVEWGYLGMFNPLARVDSALYILEKNNKQGKDAVFIKLNHIYETKRYEALFEAYKKYIAGSSHELLFTISQSKLKIIKSWPFIYWISDEFRKKFRLPSSAEFVDIKSGLATANNIRFLRYWWEVDKNCISRSHFEDKLKWVRYAKGGSFNKWYGNLWLVVNWGNNGEEMRATRRAVFRNKQFYFKKGITYSATSTKGTSFRVLPPNCVYDVKGASAFVEGEGNYYYVLALFNSKLNSYIISCLNSTVETQVGDIKRVPYANPNITELKIITALVNENIVQKQQILSYQLQEPEFIKSPILLYSESSFVQRIRSVMNDENHIIAHILVNEFILNELIYKIYELSEMDKRIITEREGECIGGLPVSQEARDAYLLEAKGIKEIPLNVVKDSIRFLPSREFTIEEREEIENSFLELYQSNNNLEEFCIRHQINPINVWYWFKKSNIVPKQRMNTLSMEFLADMIREILMEDEDGIIPLVPNAGEKVMLDHIEEKFYNMGLNLAQYSNFDTVLGYPIHEYINKHFFADLSEHLNLFPNLPKTPFIWHLSSGPEKGFDCYIIIYKWSRDKLMRLRSVYIEHRERSLINRQSDLAGNESAEAQNEKDRIFRQLKEIEAFKIKIDELLAEGYNPILDDGVGKNIAPLQKKKMIPYEVLNAGQLKKYLNADW